MPAGRVYALYGRHRCSCHGWVDAAVPFLQSAVVRFSRIIASFPTLYAAGRGHATPYEAIAALGSGGVPASSEKNMLTAGTKLGPYEIQAALGSGGMGEVYRARDPRLGRDVAIKVLPAAFSADPDRLRRFEQEARAGSRRRTTKGSCIAISSRRMCLSRSTDT